MNTTRYLCPLDCGWHYDIPPAELSRLAELGVRPAPRARGLKEMILSLSTQACLAENEITESRIREHLKSHDLDDFVRVIRDLRVALLMRGDQP